MEAFEWLCAILSAGLAAWADGWLFLDWRREVRQAKLAGRLAQRYIGERKPREDQHQKPVTVATTLPIVAQQPGRFYGNAATIPIPRQQVARPASAADNEPRHARAEPTWPIVDLDRLAASHPTLEHQPCRTT
jgi:hypothetical protein